jgi:outer membrane immunogenic protein
MLSHIVIRRAALRCHEPRTHAFCINLAAMLAVAAALGVSAVCAADLPVKAPATVPYNWGSCYAGLNAGGGATGTNVTSTVANGTHLSTADAAAVSAAGTGSANASNFLGGGQIGCNWQSGTLVYGVEGDLDYFHSNPRFNNSTNTLTDGVTPFTVTQSLTTGFLATVRPRIGVAADRNLAYVTGGVAFTNASYAQSYADAATPPGAGIATGSRSLVGWTVGAGWEHAFADRWTFRLEYLFAQFPTTNGLGAITDAGGGANPLHGSADLVIQTLRAGVNFKF